MSVERREINITNCACRFVRVLAKIAANCVRMVATLTLCVVAASLTVAPPARSAASRASAAVKLKTRSSAAVCGRGACSRSIRSSTHGVGQLFAEDRHEDRAHDERTLALAHGQDPVLAVELNPRLRAGEKLLDRVASAPVEQIRPRVRLSDHILQDALRFGVGGKHLTLGRQDEATATQAPENLKQWRADQHRLLTAHAPVFKTLGLSNSGSNSSYYRPMGRVCFDRAKQQMQLF